MKKKLLLSFFISLSLLLIGTLLTCAETYDKFTYEVLGNGEVVITGVNDVSVTEVTIPDVIDGKKVTAIGEFAFCDCAVLTKVEIGENVKEIGEAAFAGCSKLSTVVFSDSVEIIGSSAFRGCSLLENITLPVSLKIISDQAFYSCSKITKIDFPSGLEKIEADAFYDCYNLTTINIPASVTSISDGAFSACMGLVNITVDSDNKNYICDEYGVLYNIDKTILIQYPVANRRTQFVIPDTVEEIGSYAFCGAEFLMGELHLPQGITFIPKYAFFACARLQKIILPKGITGIDEFAFFSCQSLTEIPMPEKVEYIGDAAFASCTKLKTLSFPEKLNYIGALAFNGCSSLVLVTMPESMKTIGEKAFYNCTRLEELIIPEGIKIIDKELLYGCTNLKRLTVPKSAVFIAESAFCGCSSLTEIVLKDNITHIGDHAFKGCDSLEYVYYMGTEEKWKTVKISSDNAILKNVIYNFVLTSINTVYEMPYTYTDDSGVEKTVPSGVAFATVYDQYGNYELKEFGMLLTDENLEKDEFTLSKKGVIKGKGETKPNSKGQFGIMFYGNGLEYQKTYYTISYAIYKDKDGNEITIYGDNITEFSPKGE